MNDLILVLVVLVVAITGIYAFAKMLERNRKVEVEEKKSSPMVPILAIVLGIIVGVLDILVLVGSGKINLFFAIVAPIFILFGISQLITQAKNKS